MTRVEIENQLINEIHYLLPDIMENILKLALSIKNMQSDKLEALRSAENNSVVKNNSLAGLLAELKVINEIEPVEMDEISRVDRVNAFLDEL